MGITGNEHLFTCWGFTTVPIWPNSANRVLSTAVVVVYDLCVFSGDSEEVMLPCEFCEELLPSSQLAFHQVSCTS